MISGIHRALLLALAISGPMVCQAIDFENDIRPLLVAKCVRCHGASRKEGGLRLDARSLAIKGGESGAVIQAGSAGESELWRRVSSEDSDERMPPEGDPLSAAEIGTLKQWLDEGAKWEETAADRLALQDPRWNHWAWSPLETVTVPELPPAEEGRCRNDIDRFILKTLAEKGLSPAPEADRRTLLRRVCFDLIGLPPTPEQMATFLADADPRAYEKVVEQLLDSPRYGERWARHWLDVVRYADTHGYDKDQQRPNAWPYRDYVIRSLNADKPYSQFVLEQLAGDVLFPETVDGNEAIGFISAGPWDLIGHAEVPETKTDGMIARVLDRDDMVSNTMNTFCSLTVQCARCHDHKFDPVGQEDYYSLQAVFAALDRADRKYDSDPQVKGRREMLRSDQQQLAAQVGKLRTIPTGPAAEQLKVLDANIARLKVLKSGTQSVAAEYGYHSALSATQDVVKWAQIDLGEVQPLGRIVLQPCSDSFNNIGAGFGFPVRYKVELCDAADFTDNVILLADFTGADIANPGLQPQEISVNMQPARYVRITATRLAPRQNDYMLALAEVQVFHPDGKNLAQGRVVTALDSIEAPARWRKSNLVDGLYPGQKMSADPAELDRLVKEREALLENSLTAETKQSLAAVTASLAKTEAEIAALPPQKIMYAGTIHYGSGSFSGTGATGGKPRPIFVLRRGDVRSPLQPVGPGTVPVIRELPARFELPADAPEGARRVALARWITDPRNPLPWRSIVNRVWLYHFGRGIVDSPNDMGRMGQTPSHPALLDWLASRFRDGRQSLKDQHRLIVTSATYRQASASHAANEKIDGGNVYLWRMNRRRLEAEAIRDATLQVAGQLDLTMGGPGYRDFKIEHPAHSPHYEYRLFDPRDKSSYRRSVYRFIVRSQPQPFMTTLDCADPAMSVDKRNESLTALQALALLNNRFMLVMAEHFAARVQNGESTTAARIEAAFELALGRKPTAAEREPLVRFADAHGLPATCRLLLNLNEFVFID